MLKKISITGLALVAIYVGLSIKWIFFRGPCLEMFCGLSVFYPALPWLMILASIVGQFAVQETSGTIIYVLCIALNIYLAYKIGGWLEKAILRLLNWLNKKEDLESS